MKLCQEGALGKISKVNAYVGAPPTPYNLPEEPLPADLNWDLWLGPLPADIHYNNQLDPPISLDPPKDEGFWGGWRWYKEMGGGFTTDWGAHMFDIAQWGLGMDRNGPVEIGHSSCTVCTLGNIACELKRTIKWDPATETFVDDSDRAATKLMHYEYRSPWKLV